MYPQETIITTKSLTSQEQYLITVNQHRTSAEIVKVLHDAGYFHRTLLNVEKELEWSKPIPITKEEQVVSKKSNSLEIKMQESDYSNPAVDLWTQMLFAGMF